MKLTNRRDFLRHLAVTGALLPTLGSVAGVNAQTNLSKAKRVVFFYWPNGHVTEYFQPQQETGPIVHPGTDDLSFILSPLNSIHDNVVVCKNIQMSGVSQGGTLESSRTFFAATATPELSTATIDHVLADRLDNSTVLRSLMNLGVRTGNYTEYMISKPANSQRYMPENDPARASENYFADLTQSNTNKEQIFETVLKDIDALKNLEIQGMAKSKVEEYEASLAQITEKLELQIHGCGIHRTQVADPYKDGSTGPDFEHFRHIPKVVKAQIDNAVAGLACGVTNVATLQMMRAGENTALANMSFDECWEHIEAARVVFDGREVPRWWNEHTNYTASHNLRYSHAGQTRWYVEQFTYLVSELKKYNMLDDTLAVMLSNTGDGNIMGPHHGGVIVAGGPATGINPGRVVDCRNTINSSQLFVDIGQLMGLDLVGVNGWESGGAIL